MDENVNEMISEFVERTGRRPAEWRPGWTWTPSWNVAPTEDVPLLFETIHGGESTLRFEPAFWSIVPPSSAELKARFTFNARVEKLTTNGLWKTSLRNRRGIVLANGFYEWTGEKGQRVPNYIHDSRFRTIGLAALYNWWREPQFRENRESNEGWHLTATIVTADAVDEILGLHDRSPIPLPMEFWDHWLDPSVLGDQSLVDQVVTAGTAQAHHLEAYAVHPLRGDGPQLVEPV